MKSPLNSFARDAQNNYNNAASASMWWSKEADELPGAIMNELNAIYMGCGWLYYDLYMNNDVYNGSPPGSYYSSSFYRDMNLYKNVTASCVDALVSKICKNQVSVEYLATDADFETKKRAKNLQRYIQGTLLHNNLQTIGKNALNDCVVTGNGFIHMKKRKGKLYYEHIPAKYIRGMFTNSSTDDPESIHIIKLVDKFNLCNEFPEHASDIIESTFNFSYLLIDTLPFLYKNYTVVIESYSKYAKRHTVCVNTKCLLDESWDLTNGNGDTIFPLAVCRYKPSDRMFFCKGGVGQVRQMQLALNAIYTKVVHTFHMVCVPKVIVHAGGDLQVTNIANTIDVLEFKGSVPPIAWQMGVVPQDGYALIDMLSNNVAAVFGINELTSQGQKPPGIQSGEALETLISEQSDRFMMVAQSWEDLYMQVNDLTVRMLNQFPELAASHALYVGKNFQQQIKWEDCNLERDQFLMKEFPVSILPQTPSGKIETVYRLITMGLIQPQQAALMLDMPDIENFYDYSNSQFDYVDMLISKCLDGEEAYPVPQMDISFAYTRVQQAWLHYSTDGLNPDCLNLLNKLLNRLEMLQVTKTTQQQQILAQAQQAQLQMQNAQMGANPSMVNKTGRGVAAQPSSVTKQAALGRL